MSDDCAVDPRPAVSEEVSTGVDKHAASIVDTVMEDDEAHADEAHTDEARSFED